MTDRIHPSAKPNGTAPTTTTNRPPTLPPAAKSHLYNPTRPRPYRPQPTRRRRIGRSCFCLCCFWSTLLLTALVLLSAIAASITYVLYSPSRPAFSVTAVRISKFKLATTPADAATHLTSSLNVAVSEKNPNNKKIVYTYDSFAITALSNDVVIANGSFPSFASSPGNITIIRSSLSTGSQLIDADSLKSLRSDQAKSGLLPVRIVMDTTVVVEVENKLKSKKVGIRVTCDGIRGSVPKGKSPPAVASTSDAKCKVDLRIKIWKWTF